MMFDTGIELHMAGPIKLIFANGIIEYTADDPILRSILRMEEIPTGSLPDNFNSTDSENGNTETNAETNDVSDTEDADNMKTLCDVEYPDDFTLTVDGEKISVQQFHVMLTSFITKALQHALEDFKRESNASGVSIDSGSNSDQ